MMKRSLGWKGLVFSTYYMLGGYAAWTTFGISGYWGPQLASFFLVGMIWWFAVSQERRFMKHDQRVAAVEATLQRHHELHDRDTCEAEAFLRSLQREIGSELLAQAAESKVKH